MTARTKIFQVTPKNLDTINKFLNKSIIGTILGQQFSIDEGKRLYLIVTIQDNK